jgi:hypothetical protein
MGLAMVHAGLSPRKPGFGPVSVRLSYVLDTVILGPVYVQVLPLSFATAIPIILHTHFHLSTYSYQTDKRAKPGDLEERCTSQIFKLYIFRMSANFL